MKKNITSHNVPPKIENFDDFLAVFDPEVLEEFRHLEFQQNLKQNVRLVGDDGEVLKNL
jgi:hypothetical protein